MAATAASLLSVVIAAAIAAPTIDRRPLTPDEPQPAPAPADPAAPAPAGDAEGPAAPPPAGPAGPAGPVAPLVGEARPVYVGCGSMLPACERLTIVGTVAGGLGLAATLGASGLLLAPDRVIEGEPAALRSNQQAGTTLLAIGLGLVTTSLLMILTATRATNRERRRRALARLGGAR